MMKMNLYSLKMEDEGNVFNHINKFNELVSKIRNAEEDIEDEEQVSLLLASLLKSYKALVQSMLSGKSILQLYEVVELLKGSQQMISIDQSSEENQVLVVRGGQRKNYGDQYGRSFQPRDMSFVKFHYCQQFGHKQSRCPEFIEDV